MAPRRKNPLATLAMFVGVLGFGGAAWHFLAEKRILDHEDHPTPPQEEVERLRGLCHEALLDEELYEGITMFNWRPTDERFRVDIHMRDGSGKATASRVARRTSDIVERASKGIPAEVAVYVLGREVTHYVP
ncbi:MAG: hypothetical protein IT460_08565 [Planctomycetes bacterium]|nr:hypothetical protein [Planctomycetota bacterium]